MYVIIPYGNIEISYTPDLYSSYFVQNGPPAQTRPVHACPYRL